MSTTDPSRTRPTVTQYGDAASRDYADGADAYSGEGWVLFAAAMLGLLAVLNFIDGVAAVSNSKFFVGDAQFVVSDLNTWGWILIGLSLCLGALALGIGARVKGLRWIGVAIASANAVAQLVVMPAYPFWALCLFTLNILVIYGLIAHGSKPSVS
jgi:hypothetical protein